jgi:hypothetical protein
MIIEDFSDSAGTGSCQETPDTLALGLMCARMGLVALWVIFWIIMPIYFGCCKKKDSACGSANQGL